MLATFKPDPKPKALRYPKYLKFLRGLPCIHTRRRGTNTDPIVAAHQRQMSGGGTSLKPSDFHALPQINSDHQAEHLGGSAELPHQAAHDCLLHITLYLVAEASVAQMVEVIDMVGEYIKERKI